MAMTPKDPSQIVAKKRFHQPIETLSTGKGAICEEGKYNFDAETRLVRSRKKAARLTSVISYAEGAYIYRSLRCRWF